MTIPYLRGGVTCQSRPDVPPNWLRIYFLLFLIVWSTYKTPKRAIISISFLFQKLGTSVSNARYSLGNGGMGPICRPLLKGTSLWVSSVINQDLLRWQDLIVRLGVMSRMMLSISPSSTTSPASTLEVEKEEWKQSEVWRVQGSVCQDSGECLGGPRG